MITRVKRPKINFSGFVKTMHLENLNLSKSEYKEIKSIFDEIKSYEIKGDFDLCNDLWDDLISKIDLKVTEKNYTDFYNKIIRDQSRISEKQLADIKRLYFLTDYYALNGRLLEAKASWKMLMMILRNEIKDFVPLALNEFDAAIPRFS